MPDRPAYLRIADTLRDSREDLLHKAVGWMLREVGNRDRKAEEAFLAERYRGMPRTMLRFAGGREITLGDLGARQGILGGINAVIVGNYLTTLGRPAESDLDLLVDLQMPIKALNDTL